MPANVRIAGAGANRTFIEGDGKSFRVMDIASGPLVEIANVTIAGGGALGAHRRRQPLPQHLRERPARSRTRDARGRVDRAAGWRPSAAAYSTIRNSLIDTNEARPPAGRPGRRRRHLREVIGPAQELRITDSTIAFNRARSEAGSPTSDHNEHDIRLQRVTVAHNAASGHPAVASTSSTAPGPSRSGPQSSLATPAIRPHAAADRAVELRPDQAHQQRRQRRVHDRLRLQRAEQHSRPGHRAGR